MEVLGALPGGGSQARDINSRTQVTGRSTTTLYNGWRGFLWEDDEMIDIGSLGDGTHRTEPTAINDHGVIVGQGDVDSTNRYKPFVWRNGKIYNPLTELRKTGFNAGGFDDVNNSNVCSGFLTHEQVEDRRFAVTWTLDGGWEIIDEVIPPNSGWWTSTAKAINEHGQIACWAHPEGDTDNLLTILLTPIKPEVTMNTDPGALRAGEINTFSITNAQPGATIKFFYGRKGGGQRIPGCDALAAMLQFDDPKKFGEVVADANGEAQLDVFVPPGAAKLKGVLIQAVDFGNCEESQLVVKGVE